MKKAIWVVVSVVVLLLLSACRPQEVRPNATARGASLLATASPRASDGGMTGDVKVRATDGAEMVFVPAGEFLMGSNAPYYVDESPQQRVYLDAFWIDKTEVSNEQYDKCVEAGACAPSGCADDVRFNDPRQPAVCVSWYDAVQYAAWAGGRLPTEAEWEKAARGCDGREYPWGDKFDSERANTWEGGVQRTTPVGHYSPQGDSPYGAADMAGNAYEWTSTLFKGYPYDADDGREDAGATGFRVARGGSFLLNYRGCCCAARVPGGPGARSTSIGFRVALSPGPPE
jgi:formylglycine-generating enzyme required for sulfatase activity